MAIEAAFKMGDYVETAEYLRKVTRAKPVVGIICGSGLSGLSRNLKDPITIPYEQIPGFAQATVPGHTGELVFGDMAGLPTVCMRGRFHFYEGNTMDQVVFPVRVMRLLGCKLLVVTNAAGGINPTLKVGNCVIIQDHFALPCITGSNPFMGHNDDGLGPRFFPVSDTYDTRLQEITLKMAKKIGCTDMMKPNGTYCFVSGPAYESMAEVKFLRSIGGDSVGMSTIPEVLAAKHMGMKVLGLSLVTNVAIVEKKKDTVHASHEEVLAATKESGIKVEALVKAIVSEENLGSILQEVPDLDYKGKKGPASKQNGNAFNLATGLLAFAALTWFAVVRR